MGKGVVQDRYFLGCCWTYRNEVSLKRNWQGGILPVNLNIRRP